MTKKAQRAIGTSIKIGLNAIADLSSIGSPSVSTDEIDVTTLDSVGGYREFIAGFSDPGELSISGFYVPSDAGQSAVYTALKSKEILDFEVIYPASLGASWAFQGYISAFSITAETENAVEFEATIRVSGEPNLNYDVSSGLTALTVTGTGGTLAPTFDDEKYMYVFDGVSASSITMTATAADHTLKLYADGAFSQDLTSGTASSAIPLTLDVAKRLTIVAQEEGKGSVSYEIIALKSS